MFADDRYLNRLIDRHLNAGCREAELERLAELRGEIRQEENRLEEAILAFEELVEEERELVGRLRRGGVEERPKEIWVFEHFGKKWRGR